MDVHSVVEDRNRAVRRGFLAFLLGAVAFVTSCNLIFVVWLGGAPLLSQSSLMFILWSLAFIIAMAVIQLLRMSGDGRKLARSVGALPVEDYLRDTPRSKLEVQQLDNILDELCIAAHCPRPALFILKSANDINGFACGIKPEYWCITVSEGALRRLDRDATQALVAHELAHLVRGDTRSAVLTCAYITALACAGAIGAFLVWAGSSSGKEGAVLALGGLLVALLGSVGWLVALLLEASLSRDQEFRADAEAVRMTRDGDGMVKLLTQLAQETYGLDSKGQPEDKTKANWDAFFARPMYFRRNAIGTWLDTHPPLIERIRVFDPNAADQLMAQIAATRKASSEGTT